MHRAHFDTDDFFWLPTRPPYEKKRERSERRELLQSALERASSWILSGSLCGWGDCVIPMFDLVVFLWVPSHTRLERLVKREVERYGPEILNPADPRHEAHRKFMEWAAAYDDGVGSNMRCKVLHEEWMTHLPCPVLRLEGDRPTSENMDALLSFVDEGSRKR